MKIKETLDNIGKVIAVIIIIIIFIQIFWIWNTKCDITDINTVGECITGLIFILIPDEVTIAQGLQSFPYLMIIVLLFYWKFVSQYLDSGN